MHKLSNAFIGIAMLCVSVMPSSAYSDASVKEPDQPALTIDIDAVARKALETFRVPGAAIGVICADKVLWQKGYGLRNVEHGLRVTDKTLFAIGSCTKAFTTFVVSQLVEEGFLSWDDPVVKHLPEFVMSDDRIISRLTLRDCATHRSGLPRHDLVWFCSDQSRQELLQRLGYLPFSLGLRERFQYNNLLYMVLGIVVERVTHHSWEDEVRRRILVPLGMCETNFSVEQSQLQPDFSMPYTERNNKLIITAFHPLKGIGPAGSINSSVKEMVQWLRLNLSDGIVSGHHFLQKRSIRELHTVQVPLPDYPNGDTYVFGYGLGWVTGVYKGHYCVMHDGGIDGFSSSVLLFPHDQVGIVVLTNSDTRGGDVAVCLSRSVVDDLLHLESEDWITKIQAAHSEDGNISDVLKKDPGSDEILPCEEYVGEYSHPGYGTILVTHENGKLCARYGSADLLLRHTKHDSFVAVDDRKILGGAAVRIGFSRDLFGDIVDVRIPMDDASGPIVFTKHPPQELTPVEYLKSYVGKYEGSGMFVEIFFYGTNLMIEGQTLSLSKLRPVHQNVFSIEGCEAIRFAFKLNEGGTAQTVVVDAPGGIVRLSRCP